MEPNLRLRQIVRLLAAVAATVVGGTVGFRLILHESWAQSLYRAVITATLTGLDTVPSTDGARALSIVMVLPLGVLGGVLASSVRGLPNDVYFQIGLLTVLGLTTKNAILIVQFAQGYMKEGMGLIQATLLAAKVRLRPIVMTSLAFGFGVLPLALSTGAGAGAQVAIGTSVLGGMLSGTFLAVVFIPLFFVVIVRLFSPRRATALVPQRTTPGLTELPAEAI